MQHVGVREFRDNATKYLSSSDMLAVEKHGKLIGYYIPVLEKDVEQTRQALEALRAAVQRILDETGMTEDELADLFDLNKPFDDAPRG
jgi:hypothetical protein